MNDRARLTITDVLFVLIAVMALTAFYPVFADLLNQNASSMGRGASLIMQTVLPVSIIVLIGYIYIRAGVGAQ